MFVYSDQFTHNALQVCGTSDPIFIEISSSLELGRIEVRLDAFSVPVSHLKKFFTVRTFGEPCRWTLLHISWWTTWWLLRNVSNLIWRKMGSLHTFQVWTRQQAQLLRPYILICIPIYWPKCELHDSEVTLHHFLWLDTRQPKTFLLYSRYYILLEYVSSVF